MIFLDLMNFVLGSAKLLMLYPVKKMCLLLCQLGEENRYVGLEISGDPYVGSNDERWPVLQDQQNVGYVTSAICSPRLEKNIALAMVSSDAACLGTVLEVNDGKKLE